MAILAVLVLGTAAFLTRGQWLPAVGTAVDAVDAAVDGGAEHGGLATGGEVVAPPVAGVDDPDELGSEPTGDMPARDIAAGEFAATVQPILETRCVSCHTTGGPAWSTLALDTAADAAAIADDIAFVTGISFMPPWLPSDLSPEFVHDWSLSDAEKAAIRAWADAGGGLDVRPGTPLVARVQAVIPIEEDQRIGPRDGLYTGYSRPDGLPVKKDDYRCQVHEVADPEGDGTWVKGFEFRPDQASVVHHAIVYRVPAAAADEIAARIAAEDRIETAAGLAD